MELPKSKYRVLVDNNFHYMDKSERYSAGEYDSCEQAIEKCKRSINKFLLAGLKPSITLSSSWRCTSSSVRTPSSCRKTPAAPSMHGTTPGGAARSFANNRISFTLQPHPWRTILQSTHRSLSEGSQSVSIRMNRKCAWRWRRKSPIWISRRFRAVGAWISTCASPTRLTGP